MHMADALLSPAVGGAMWAATAGTTFYCSRKLGQELDDSKIPLMGVLGAFVFAAQMINFTIPGTGSSGHLGGGLLLAVLLGPHAAFLVIASVLTVQALFFADGGLLALGSNIFNLGVFPCFLAYPLIFKKIVADCPSRGKLLAGSLVAAVVSLQLGSLAVVVQTTLSGIAELPFAVFILLMQPIHLAIGLVEGLATAAVISFLWQARPELLAPPVCGAPAGKHGMRPILGGLLAAALLIGGVFSWFASERPDGLEWSMAKTSGGREVEGPASDLHRSLARLQEKTALLPDYAFKKGPENKEGPGTWGSPKAETTVAGVVGGMLILLAVVLGGLLLKKKQKMSRVD
ncbi:MAG: cobalamin biosynthesis protein CbiM [Deltaproteobacteria bacterium RIFOXYD12_FULL_57_12]|nr:MAG: cobalamin biosynthesis protein CbiM [Deltaproteobacteria bacterium RIFOXYD12_FULL_57_12]